MWYVIGLAVAFAGGMILESFLGWIDTVRAKLQ